MYQGFQEILACIRELRQLPACIHCLPSLFCQTNQPKIDTQMHYQNQGATALLPAIPWTNPMRLIARHKTCAL